MIREAIGALVGGGGLDEAAAAEVMAEVMRGEATPAQVAGFLIALRLTGAESAAVLAGAARAMRDAATPVPARSRPLVDTCGTGGDGRSTFNVSTVAAFVVAGAGQPVAKHGNRAASGRSGGADCLERLGVRLEVDAADAARAIDDVGIAFLFAPSFHPSMRHVAPVRRELGVRTVMNLLGPLTNPAGADRQVVGVSSPEHLPLVAEALARLGTAHALVVHDRSGCDEITPVAPADAVEVRDGRLVPQVIDPRALGVAPCDLDDLTVADADASASVARSVLAGERGPARDTVLLNAAAALYVAGRAEDLREGMALAARSLDSGAAAERLEALRRFVSLAGSGERAV
ncbi:MAG: anthranilate phosphoribosyltransferase [Firmicutes bacterium]|nr:anthranilate phosphoribosyltransferase [Bacillota bacterium]